MRRYVGIAAGTALVAAVLSVSGALPALAQGALKPLAALIVNDESHPVPVLVTNTTSTPDLVKCSLDIGSVGGTDPIATSVGSLAAISNVECPAGVTCWTCNECSSRRT
ncbi:hypothetical protein LuPra_03962 [Luteitalea pratensis]|uniref:Uncharacterized protein n=1 Tax=Luteitalea pratensis TaxID=1855912 RepID=A0A143PRD7_LUTPR|nr:hypothetical protein [Luteitalea pratensis]AMY10723.1 hypothetical protein LuPra_03962 [Luteitalea pratensis]